MYTRYYDTYPAPTKEDVKLSNDTPAETAGGLAENTDVSKDTSSTASVFPFGGLGGFKGDDILLIALLFLVMSESREDNIMPLILGYLLLGGGI